MFIVTTLSYDELSTLIRDKKVSLNNESLILGGRCDLIRDYITNRLGSNGFVMAIKGDLCADIIKYFVEFDEGLKTDRVIIEAPVDIEDLLVFNVMGLKRAIEIFLNDYCSEEDVIEALDDASVSLCDSEQQIVCTPYIKKSCNVKIASPFNEVDVSATGLTLVKLSGGDIKC